MAILFAGGELDGFSLANTTNVVGTTTSATFDGTFSRSAVEISGDGSNFVEVDFAAQTEGWAHVLMNTDSPGSGTLAAIELIDSAGPQTVLQLDQDSGEINLEYWNGASFTEVGPSLNNGSSDSADRLDAFSFVAGNELVAVDMHWRIADVGGVFECFLNGFLVWRFEGDTLNAGFTQVDRLRLATLVSFSFQEEAYSEVIVATEDTRDMRLATLEPTADGSNTAWTGTFADVDEVALNDTDLISSGTAAQVETLVAANLPTNDYDVRAVAVNARARDNDVSPDDLELAVRAGGTDFFGSVQALTTTFDGYYEVWNTNPNTAAQWTRGEVDALEFGARSSA